MADPVEVYSSGVLVSSGTLSEEQELEQGGCNSMFVHSGGTAVETIINEGTVLTADSGAVIKGINIEAGGLLSAVDAHCSGASRWYGPVACATSGDIILSGGTYTKNMATDLNEAIGFGGVVEVYAGSLSIAGGLYSGNSATGGGGAVYVNGGVSIDGAEFSANSALYGGAVEMAHVGSMTITNAVFFGNSAGYGGGFENHQGASTTITDTIFDGNTAISGGAVLNDNYQLEKCFLTVNNVTFTGNTAEQGGAIQNDGVLTVSGGVFSRNEAEDGKGGALYNVGTATVTGAEFTSNTGIYGGAVWQGKKTLALEGNTFTGNTAIYGGALYGNTSGSTIISGGAFIGNSASYDEDYKLGGMGGALYLAGATTVTITDAIFKGNYAEVNPANEWDGGCGGAVINYGEMTVSGGAFTANSAYYGAGLYNQAPYPAAGESDGTLTVTGTDFADNVAEWGGGAICNCYGTLTVTGGNYSGNKVTGANGRDGGAIANWSDATITGATFTANTASKGGALSHTGTTLTVTDSILSGNAADDGGAFWSLNEWGDSVAEFVNCTFSGNTATQGGAIWNGEELYLSGCTFTTATDSIYNAGTITVTGETTFSAAVENGETGVFTVALTAAADPALVNGWAFISGGTVGIDVAAAADGSYSVATGVETWSGSISLAFGGEASGSAFTVENGVVTTDTVIIGDRTFTLANDGGAFKLTVETGVTVAATVVGEFFGAGSVFRLMSDGSGTVRTIEAVIDVAGSVDPDAWSLVTAGDFAGLDRDGLLWVEKSTGYAYMQYDMNSFAEVNDKTNCLGIVGEGYSIKAAGDFSASGIDGVLMQGPVFGDPEISLNYGLPVWARDNTGVTYNGWLGALVNTWQEGEALKGDLTDPASINANNYKYDVVGVGDFDGDGRDDVMLQNTMPKTVNQGGTDYTITGSGDIFTFLTGSEEAIKAGDPPIVAYAGCATGGWSIVGAGDFDGDGIDDVLLSNGTGVAGWKMAAGRQSENFWFGTLQDGYEISGVADVDVDGTDDIVLHSVADDRFCAWKVDNGVVTGVIALK